MPSRAVSTLGYGPRFSGQRFKDDQKSTKDEIALVKKSLDPKEKTLKP